MHVYEIYEKLSKYLRVPLVDEERAIFHDSHTSLIGSDIVAATISVDAFFARAGWRFLLRFILHNVAKQRESGAWRNKRCTLAQLYRNRCKFIPLLSKDFVLAWSSIFLLPSTTPLRRSLPWKKVDLAVDFPSFFFLLLFNFFLSLFFPLF